MSEIPRVYKIKKGQPSVYP